MLWVSCKTILNMHSYSQLKNPQQSANSTRLSQCSKNTDPLQTFYSYFPNLPPQKKFHFLPYLQSIRKNLLSVICCPLLFQECWDRGRLVTVKGWSWQVPQCCSSYLVIFFASVLSYLQVVSVSCILPSLQAENSDCEWCVTTCDHSIGL